jgi:hypothetical protein
MQKLLIAIVVLIQATILLLGPLIIPYELYNKGFVNSSVIMSIIWVSLISLPIIEMLREAIHSIKDSKTEDFYEKLQEVENLPDTSNVINFRRNSCKQ